MAQGTTPCVTYSNVFLHPLMSDDKSPKGRGEVREQQMLQRQADKLCAQCPLRPQCLNDAVTKFNVDGFVAGTTSRQRLAIRAQLGVSVAPEDFDSFAGVTTGRQYDGDEIFRLRQANPDQPLSVIANKIGCSVSTVKRHLRRGESQRPRKQTVSRKRPSLAAVLAAAEKIKRGASSTSAA